MRVATGRARGWIPQALETQGHDHGRGDREIENRGGSDGAGEPGRGHEVEPAHQHAHGGAQAVRKVEQGEHATGGTAHPANEAGAHEREGGTEEHRLGQDEQARDGPAGECHPRCAGECGEEMVVGRTGHGEVGRVEQEPEASDDGFDHGVDEQRLAQPGRAAADEQGAGRHAAEEDDQDDHLRVGAVAHE